MSRLTKDNTHTHFRGNFQCSGFDDLICLLVDCKDCAKMDEMLNKLGQYEDICDNHEELKEAWEKSRAEQTNFSGDDWHECPNVDYENGIKK